MQGFSPALTGRLLKLLECTSPRGGSLEFVAPQSSLLCLQQSSRCTSGFPSLAVVSLCSLCPFVCLSLCSWWQQVCLVSSPLLGIQEKLLIFHSGHLLAWSGDFQAPYMWNQKPEISLDNFKYCIRKGLAFCFTVVSLDQYTVCCQVLMFHFLK